MRARALALLVVASVLLSACAVTTSSPPASAGSGTAAIVATVPLSVASCEPDAWCVAAGTNPSASTETSALEVSHGGTGVWVRGAVPPLPGVSLTTASCWRSGCLLGGQGPNGSIVVLVNAKHRDASVAAPIPGQAVTSIDCLTAGHCIALVATTAATVVFRTTTSGATWQRLSVLPGALAAGTSIACPSPRLCVAVGTGPRGAEAARSGDSGATWKLASRPAGLQIITSVACTPNEWCVAIARQSNGVMRLLQSRNGGASWMYRATSVAVPESLECVVGGCLVGGGRGALSAIGQRGQNRALRLDYVELPIIAIGCATESRCAAITTASTVSFVA